MQEVWLQQGHVTMHERACIAQVCSRYAAFVRVIKAMDADSVDRLQEAYSQSVNMLLRCEGTCMAHGTFCHSLLPVPPAPPAEKSSRQPAATCGRPPSWTATSWTSAWSGTRGPPGCRGRRAAC
jgi:hypothetical protein